MLDICLTCWVSCGFELMCRDLDLSRGFNVLNH